MSLYPLFSWFGVEWLRIPMPVTLLCACVFSYVLGRFGFNLRKLTCRSNKLTLSAGENVVDELKQIADSIRSDLADYDKRLNEFKLKIAAFDESEDVVKQELAQAARATLASTQEVTGKISEAFHEIHQQSDDLADLADSHRDNLTGLQSRRAVQDALKRMFAMRSRYELPFSLITLGKHDVQMDGSDAEDGLLDDEQLKGIARVVSRTVRDTDLVARYDDQHFVVLLPYATSEAARMLAGRLCERANADLKTRVSAGVVSVDDADDPITLVERSLAALDQARDDEKSGVYFDDTGLSETVDEDETLSEDDAASEDLEVTSLTAE